MSARDLLRRLSSSIVDTLRLHGRILVVKGSSAALARELEARMTSAIEAVVPRIERRTQLDGEVTSTFGDEAIDEIVEETVADLTGTLMDSEHVEDVFAEDNVIERDIFRVLRDGLLGGPGEENDGDAGPEPGGARPRGYSHRDAILVRLDTLGYVASTVGKRAPEATLRETLGRVARSAGGELTAYNPEVREATFSLPAGGPDARLELEEAVADELTELVSAKVVALPTVVRRIELRRAVGIEELSALRPRIDAAVARSLLQNGCAAAWELEGDRSVKVTVTPLSEQDALAVDHHVEFLARELGSLLADERVAAAGEQVSVRPAPPVPAGERCAPEVAAEDEAAEEMADEAGEEEEEATAEISGERAPATRARATRTAKTGSSGKAATKAPAKAAATKKAPAEKAPAEKAPAEKAPAKRATKDEPLATKAPAEKAPAERAAKKDEPPARAKVASAGKEPAKPPAKKKTR